MNAYILPGTEIKASHVINACERVFELSDGETYKKTRKRQVKDARFMAMFFLHRWLKIGQAQAGFIFGKDHATVFYACSKIEGWILYEKPLRDKFLQVAQLLGVSNQFIKNYAA